MKLVLLLLPLVCLMGRSARSQDNQNVETLKSSFLQFGAKVVKAIESNIEGNYFLSSLAWYESAALIYNGARGETVSDFAEGYGFQDVESTNAAFADINPDLRDVKSGKNAYAQVFRKLFVTNDYKVNATFKKVAEEIYSAKEYDINFQIPSDTVTAIINHHFSEDSRGVFDEVLPFDIISSANTLVSLSAVFKQGKWDVPFDPSSTSTVQFSVTESKNVSVEMMAIESAELDYYEDTVLEVKYVALPFHDSSAYLLIVLPTKVDGLKDLIPHLEQTANPPLKKTKVSVKLPKFHLLSRWDVKSLAEAVQIDKPFGKDVDLSGISGKPGNVTDDVEVQQAYIRVNEAGILVPASEYQGGSQEQDEDAKEVTADHPFLFHIVRLGVITSAGRVTNPAEPVNDDKVIQLPSGKPKEE